MTERDPIQATGHSGCDNYPEYLDQAWGYSYVARDIVSVATLDRHDQFVDAEADELDELERDELDDFLLWGVARGYRSEGRIDGFVDCVDRLLESDDGHAALDYREIHLSAARSLVSAHRFDRARDVLDRYVDRWPDAAMPAQRERCLVEIEAGDGGGEQVRSFLATHDDPEAALELAEDLAAADRPDLARDVVARARERTRQRGDSALMVDVELIERQLEE